MTKRSAPRWLIDENKKILKERANYLKEKDYNSECTHEKKAICRTFMKLDFYIPNCKLYDECKCEIKKEEN